MKPFNRVEKIAISLTILIVLATPFVLNSFVGGGPLELPGGPGG